MLVRTAARKTSKFEDSDSNVMSKPARAVFEMPQRSSPRAPPRLRTTTTAPAAVAGYAYEHHRALIAGKGTSPRSPLNEKKPTGAGAGSRVAELEAKLGKAHDQLAEMREQLAAAEKSRKDARAALVEAKKRFSVKKRDVAASALAPVVVTDNAARLGGSDEKCGVISPAAADVPADDVRVEEAIKETADGDEVDSVNAAVVADRDGNTVNHVVDQLRAKLTAKETEVYELKSKVMAMEAEVDVQRANLTTKDMEIEELRAMLVAKDAELAALEGDNAELMKMTEEASQTVKEMAVKARETEHALRDGAAREARVAERLRASERAREALEAEMQRGRAQSEQWRKAAEEAALVLGGAEYHATGVEKWRLSSSGSSGERMAKDVDENQGSGGKRKVGASGGAMRLLTDLWKKKGQK
ncbi:hypothetical protein GUJ93_ZPchr0005g15640 [Zizania palustris]|uniref:Uncharacterized protein n=1 Tax=Zizania palustris TaxID=103762 RepID=A0A8J5SWD0_ZIZPA|nr:hypothetical protein GUJ93_ZPchr0005g15640 [Zizania palustris]